MATCALLGEAVGTAANIAREFSTTPNGVYEAYIGLLQQRLMENGCFLPHFKREIADICKNANLMCEGDTPSNLDNLRNGIDRNNSTYGEEDYCVALPIGKAVTYSFKEPVKLSNVHLAFDSDLNRDTLPGNHIERQRSMFANRTVDSATACVSKTLVKAYSITATTRCGNTFVIADINRNLLSCVNHVAPNEKIVSISFIPKSTWGNTDTKINVFSFDVR